MSVTICDGKDVQDFLRVVANLDGGGGNERAKKIVHRILSDLFKTIEDFDLTPDEIWAGINYVNKLGSEGEAALLAAGLGLEHYIDLRLDAEDKELGITGGTPRTIEGPLYVAGAPVAEGKARLDKNPDPDAAPLRIHGTVTGPDGAPVAGALVEIWHSDSKGFYSHFDPTGRQSEFNLRGAIRTGADGRYEALTKMPASYGCPPSGSTQTLLNLLNRHGNRPAHVHFFVTTDKFRKLTTQFNIEGDPLIWDDFAFATREGLIPHIVEKNDGRSVGFDEDAYRDIEFNLELTPLVHGKDNQVVNRARAAA
ncbi:catechol 1,2-dioxygenase [Labrys portucalensis]|uniref:catechol 1,2-dioxygenase n=1 Tax=Labrys neptuniae TaxID=376174 RepID=A0ABV6ZN51_9HYPH